jgi:hypothetical protein
MGRATDLGFDGEFSRVCSRAARAVCMKDEEPILRLRISVPWVLSHNDSRQGGSAACYPGAVLSLVGLAPARRTLQSPARIVAVIVAALGLALGCQGGRDYFTQLADSHRMAAELRIQFNQAADASNRAVMADTDEASTAFARDAEKALQIVDNDVKALMPLLQRLSFSKEIQLLEEFGKHFSQYRELDRTILTLAVENTNLKAQDLAFGPAREAADNFRNSLDAVALKARTKDRCRIEGLIANAVLAVREIQVLYGPHIAEPNDAAMTNIEQAMANLDANASAAVTSLTEIVPRDVRPALSIALSALDRFKDFSRQIVALSRRNTNVRSLKLSLQTKPALTAACDGNLRVLQDLLTKEDIKATR